MARPEKTVFISYRRKDISWALAVYQYLTSQKYDVFFDYTSIPSGDFEQIIVSNIKARAHFVLILTPTSLDRCNEPGDWLRREIETAIDEKRNIIPLFFDGFNFGLPSISKKLTGKLGTIQRYNGLDIPSGYFVEAMERLRDRYLNVPLNAIIHPVSTEVQRAVKEEQVAVSKALIQKKADIEELVKPVEEKINEVKQEFDKGAAVISSQLRGVGSKDANARRFSIGAGILALALIGIFGTSSLIRYFGKETPKQTSNLQLNSPYTETPVMPTQTLGVGNTMVSSQDGMILLYVSSGEFTMGSGAGDDDEKPIHQVYLDAFWIDQTEITNDMFAKFISETSYVTDMEKLGYSFVYQGGESWLDIPGTNWSHPRGPASDISEMGDYSVVHVSWNDAKAYCDWAGRRLPTEAEWEKAASWDDSTQSKNIYPWGDGIDCSVANYNDGNEFCVGAVTRVGSHVGGASKYGALDMAGNAWEWVADWYSSSYYSNSPSSNPSGPDSGEGKVIRGGSWFIEDNGVRSANRDFNDPAFSSDDFGYRCAMSASE